MKKYIAMTALSISLFSVTNLSVVNAATSNQVTSNQATTKQTTSKQTTAKQTMSKQMSSKQTTANQTTSKQKAVKKAYSKPETTNQTDVTTDNFKLTMLNRNGARNWELANGKPLVQKLNDNKITYQIQTNDELYKTAFENAIQNWNSLGVIELVPTDKNPQITLKGSYDSKASKDYDGITEFSVQKASLDDKKLPYVYLADTEINLPGHITDADNPNIAPYTMIVAMHEIGHALGFDHDNSTSNGQIVHVMSENYSSADIGNVQKINDYERATLSKYYSPQLQHSAAIKK